MGFYVNCTINQDYQVIAKDDQDHTFHMDISKNHGGGTGFMPMHVMLASLGGCLSLDIKYILLKMRCQVEKVDIDINAQTDTHHKPNIFNEVHITVKVWGDASESQVKKALHLAETEYCNVSAMFKKFANLKMSIHCMKD